MITISISSTDINGHDFGPDDPSQEALIVQSDALLDAFFTHLDQTIDFRNILIAVTGDHGGATSQKAGDADRMPVLEFPAELFTKPLEKMLEAKYPLKDKGADILQMDNPYLPLNREAFEAAGLSAVNTTATMLKQVFASFSDSRDTESRREPPVLTHVYTSKQMREGPLPDTQYSRLIAHSYSPNAGWALHINFCSLRVSLERKRHNTLHSQ